MSRQILLPTAVKSEMMKTFKVDRCTLGRALTYKINSPTAKMLRAAAFQRGGLIYRDFAYDKGFIPDCSTSFDHARGLIKQAFGGEFELIINRETTIASILLRGEEVAKFPNMTTEKWGQVVYAMQMIYNNL